MVYLQRLPGPVPLGAEGANPGAGEWVGPAAPRPHRLPPPTLCPTLCPCWAGLPTPCLPWGPLFRLPCPLLCPLAVPVARPGLFPWLAVTGEFCRKAAKGDRTQPTSSEISVQETRQWRAHLWDFLVTQWGAQLERHRKRGADPTLFMTQRRTYLEKATQWRALLENAQDHDAHWIPH